MDHERLGKVWSWVTATSSSQHPAAADGGLQAVCRAALRLGVDGASVTVMTAEGVPTPAAASDRLAADLEELHFTLGEGPSADALAGGGPILVPELAVHATRWPGFVPAALQVGAGAVFAFPLQRGAIAAGVMALHRIRPGSLGVIELADALVLAAVALEVLGSGLRLADVDAADYEPSVEELGPGRAPVHQATGMIAEQLGVGLAEALLRLRAKAYSSGRGLGEVAADVVAGRLRLPAEPGPELGSGAPDPG